MAGRGAQDQTYQMGGARRLDGLLGLTRRQLQGEVGAGWLVFWLIMAVVVAMIVGSKGRSFIGWFLYGFLIWPIALVHIFVSPAKQAVIEKRQIAEGSSRKCPYCAEIIKAEAKVCRFCGRDLPTWAGPPATV